MKTSTISRNNQYYISLVVITVVTLLGLAFLDLVGHRVIAFMLLFSVSALALFVDIKPVIVSAVLSALIWDFLFVPPRFQITVGDTEDQLILATYFIIATIHAVLTYRIREAQEEVRSKELKAKAAKFYNTLLNSLSHELRTPITTILGATDNLQTNGDKISEKDKQELLSEISIASTRLNQQVENLLSMSRLESGVFQVRMDWCDVKELVYKILQSFEPAIAKWRVTVFIPEDLPLFKLDFGLMEQILHNLISNILQHTAEGTDIIIRAECHEEKLILTISDTGNGFPEAEIHNVFDKFYRVKGSRPGGTGLGLSIVKGFVEAQHGTIQLRNRPLSGAEFEIEFPTAVSYLNRLKNE